MSPARIRVCIDYSTLDHPGLGGGQNRYVEDLISDLEERPELTLDVLGSMPAPSLRIAASLARRPDWSYVALPAFRWRGAYFANQIRYVKLLHALKTDVFHCVHNFIPLLFPRKILITVHGMLFEVFDEYREARRSAGYRRYRWAVRRRVDHILASSHSTARDLDTRWGVPSDKVTVAPLGYSQSLGPTPQPAPAAVTSRGDLPSAPLLLSPYNLEPRKNLAMLAEAFAALVGQRPSLRLVLFGRAAWTAEREAAFDQLLHKLGIAALVDRPGFVDDAALGALYARASVFVFPSLYEGFGLPVLEAMARGSCVVAVDRSSMPEIIGDAGVLVAEPSSAAFAREILALLDNEQLRRELSRRAARRALPQTSRATADATWAAYRSLALGPGTR